MAKPCHLAGLDHFDPIQIIEAKIQKMCKNKGLRLKSTRPEVDRGGSDFRCKSVHKQRVPQSAKKEKRLPDKGLNA